MFTAVCDRCPDKPGHLGHLVIGGTKGKTARTMAAVQHSYCITYTINTGILPRASVAELGLGLRRGREEGRGRERG